MNTPPSFNLDAIFWVGNTAGATVVNYTTGRTYALITKSRELYDIRLFLNWFDRIRLYRRLRSFKRGAVAWPTFAYMELDFEGMFAAIIEIDAALERLGLLPLRVEPWERYYLLRGDPITPRSQNHQEVPVGL
jgi:hypothetical protein